MKNKHLIFVYNANSGLANAFLDLLHKNISPKTYSCNLCALTYNNFGMKSSWRKFIDELDYKATFLHKDELLKEFPLLTENELPAIFVINENNIPKILISAQEMNALKNLDELQSVMKVKLDLKL